LDFLEAGKGRAAVDFLEAGPRPKLAGREPHGGRGRVHPRRFSGSLMMATATGCNGKNGGYGELYIEERNKMMWRGRLKSGSSDVDLRYCCSELTATASSPQQGKATGGVILLLVSCFWREGKMACKRRLAPGL
jgi:hypothetical protein